MGTIADKFQLLLENKEDIRAAIVEKGQDVPATAPLSAYGDKIRAIQTGADTSNATATAGDILSGKTAYVDGEKVTGTMPAATQATPSISVSSAGLITASATQEEGHVASGTKSATKQLTTQGAKTITPGTAAKTAVAAGRYTTEAVTVKGDANLIAGNIKSGVSIFGVAGSYTGGGSGSASPTAVKLGVQNVLSPKAFYTSDNTSLTDTLTLDYKGIANFSVYGPFVLSASPSTPGKQVVCVGEAVIKEISTGWFLVLPTASAATIALGET